MLENEISEKLEKFKLFWEEHEMTLRKKFDIQEMIDSIAWEKCSNKERLGILKEELIVNFRNAGKAAIKDKINQIYVRFGGDIIKELRWDDGDKLMCLYDPKDLTNFMIVKCKGMSKGVRLSKELAGHPYKTAFTWAGDKPLIWMPSTKVDWAIYKDGLYFKVEQPQGNENGMDKSAGTVTTESY